jgi:hypothetical protein
MVSFVIKAPLTDGKSCTSIFHLQTYMTIYDHSARHYQGLHECNVNAKHIQMMIMEELMKAASLSNASTYTEN